MGFWSKTGRAQADSAALLPDSAPAQTLRFAGKERPLLDGTLHFAVMGSTGSGKTTILRQLMQSVIPKIGPGPGNHRALVYDPKREFIPLLYGMAPAAEIFILNPFDSRTLAWDLAADVTTPNEANAVASVLIPEDEGASQRYFSDAARSLVASVMTAFALGVKSRDWTLRDVILALRDPNRLKAVVALHRATEDKAQPYLADSRVLPSVLSTVATKMDQFDVVAAFWARATAAGRKFSIRRWLGGRGVVVLGASPANRANVDPINRAFFKRLSDLLLEQQDKAESYTWLFLDELREAGYLDGLRSLMNQGRSKGVCVALGFQDIEGLECAYPDGEAGEILGQCSHGAFLRTNSHKSAEWVQSHFAESEFHETEYTEGSSTGREGTTSSVSTTVKRARYTNVLAAEVLGLPRTSVANGLSGFFDLPDHPVFRACLRFQDLGLLAPSSAAGHVAIQDWTAGDSEAQMVTPWSDEEARSRLGLKLGGQVQPPREPDETDGGKGGTSALRSIERTR